MTILLVTPPLVQLNTPYPSTPALAGFLAECGAAVRQTDLSLELVLRLFSHDGLDQIAESCRAQATPSPLVRFFLDRFADYRSTVASAVAFLQGRDDAAGWLIARRGYLPEGPRFDALAPAGTGLDADQTLAELFGDLGVIDRAKLLASLYLDDLADIVREGVDPAFGFARYAERLALSAPSFDPLLERLSAPPTLIDALIDELAEEALRRHVPDIVGLTLPFPGTVYAAFRIAAAVRRFAPAVRIVFGGGYVNTELREVNDPRVFEYVDDLCFDEGFAPWLGILGQGPHVRTLSTKKGDLNAQRSTLNAQCSTSDIQHAAFHVPSYAGLDLSRYLNLVEMANPMHRLWSDGKWLKLQLANGCYWHRCAFCDVALDYIGRYETPETASIVAAIVRLKRETGQSGFHFTDEALAPALVRRFCEALLASGETVTWWGNIRFEKGFTPALADLMARAGCIAVTGGLECAHDRLLRLMNKGVTLDSAARACQAFSEAGILVHAYLMYGFPTQTEDETVAALEYVRRRFADGHIQSAYWHRFALTTHSPIARDPAAFGIRLLPEAVPGRRFARNEIPYEEPGAPDHARLGEGLRLALYNYMLGLGLDRPAHVWLKKKGLPQKRRNGV